MKCTFLRRGKAAAVIAVSASAIALGGALPATSASAAPVAAARPAAPAWVGPVVLGDCHFHGLVMPRSFILSCADHNDFLTGLHWVTWRHVAFGSGIEHVNNCVPNCSHGRFHRFKVLITLWRAKPRGHHGQFKFTRLTLLYPRHRPLRFTIHGKKHHPLTFTFHV